MTPNIPAALNESVALQPPRDPQRRTLGGHCRGDIYGRLDCRVALRAIDHSGYLHALSAISETNSALIGNERKTHLIPPLYNPEFNAILKAVRD